jgi:hypothetical protein
VNCVAGSGAAASCRAGPQHFLYFLPLPQEQASFLPGFIRGTGTHANTGL